MEAMAHAVAQARPFFVATGLRRPHLAWRQPRKFWEMYNNKEISLAKHQEMGEDVPLLAFEMNGPAGQLFCHQPGLPTKCNVQQLALAEAADRVTEADGANGYASDMQTLGVLDTNENRTWRAGPHTPLPADLQREFKRACEYFLDSSERLQRHKETHRDQIIRR